MKIFRVTEVLKPYTDFSQVPDDGRLELAGERGEVVHRALACIVQGLWCPLVLADFQGYLDSFMHFLPLVKTVQGVELRLVDERLGFSGAIDLLGEIEGQRGISIVDWKTPVSQSPTWAGQMAAYKHLAKADHAGTLQLNPNGGIPKMTWYEHDPYALPAFLSALNAMRYFHKKGGECDGL